MTKRELRMEVRRRMTLMAPEQRVKRSSELCSALLNDPDVLGARTVAMFVPMQDEPDVRAAIDELCRRCRVVVPSIDGEEMEFVVYDAERLADGRFSIPVPVGTGKVPAPEIDVMVVPGRAFTPSGCRCGRGRGYYDRYMALSGFRAVTVGVCFSEQMFDSIPTDEFDHRVDRVIWA